MNVDQFLASLSPGGDAIGDSVRAIRDYLRQRGYASEVYVRYVTAETEAEARTLEQYPFPQNAIRLVHYSDDALNDFIAQHQLPIRLLYHNVTPAHFYNGLDEDKYIILSKARARLSELVPFAECAAGNSRFTENDLRQSGFRRTGTFMPNTAQRLDGLVPGPQLLDRLAERHSLLFVGRMAPNKRQDDLIKLLWYYRQIDPRAELVLIGGWLEQLYGLRLKQLAYDLHLEAQVHFAGHVSHEELVAYYQSAGVFVSASEHEGFGLPLIESMRHQLPVIAYGSTAVPEIVEGAGVVVRHKRFEEWAVLIDRVINDAALRRQIIAAQNRRLADYSREKWEQSIQAILDLA